MLELVPMRRVVDLGLLVVESSQLVVDAGTLFDDDDEV